MDLRTPPIASRSVPFLIGPDAHARQRFSGLNDVGTAQENRVAFTPVYWKPAGI